MTQPDRSCRFHASEAAPGGIEHPALRQWVGWFGPEFIKKRLVLLNWDPACSGDVSQRPNPDYSSF